MPDKNNSNGPKTVPLKKTSSIPLKKETVRVSVKADPLRRPPSDATIAPAPAPLPKGMPIPAPVSTVPLSSSSAPSIPTPPPAPTSIKRPSVKTVPLNSQGAPSQPTKSTGPVPSPLTAPMPSKAPVVKTVPLSGTSSVSLPLAPSTSADGSAELPQATKVTAPQATTAPSVPGAGKLKTQPLNSPVQLPPTSIAPQAAGAALGTSVMSPVPTAPAALATAPVTRPATPTSPIANARPSTVVAAATPTSVATDAYKKKKKANNPNKGWPFAAAALLFATASLVIHFLGYLHWNGQ